MDLGTVVRHRRSWKKGVVHGFFPAYNREQERIYVIWDIGRWGAWYYAVDFVRIG